jgi:hypothetical protein
VAVAAIFAVIMALSGIVSALSSVIALAVALASTLAGAVVIAVLAAGAALGALVVTAGLVVGAFMSMTTAQKTFFTNALAPLKTEFAGLGQLVLQGLLPATDGFQKWSNNLQNAMAPLATLAKQAGTALGEAGNIFTAALSGPGVLQFINTLGIYLPGIITNLATAAGQFTNAFGSVFAAALPYLSQFVTYLTGLITTFATWASSTAGQNAITDFAARASASIQSLWGFVTSFVDWAATVLFSPEAQALGNSMFDVLTATFQKFKEAASNGDLQKWFADATKFGGDLWALIVSLGDVFASLYNSGSLAAVGQLILAVAGGLVAVASVIGPLLNVLAPVGSFIVSTLVTPLLAVVLAITAIGDAFGWIESLFTGSNANFDKTANAWKALVEQFTQSGSQYNGTTTKTPTITIPTPKINIPSMKDLLNGLGGSGLNSAAGYTNPYAAWAQSLIDEGPDVSAKIRNAMISVNKQIGDAIRSVNTTTTTDAARSALLNVINSIRDAADTSVNTAQQALNTAANALMNSTSAATTKTALLNVKKAQTDLQQALDAQSNIYAQSNVLNLQSVYNNDHITDLLAGIRVVDATLTDYAEARGQIASRLTEANTKLTNAISLRDSYNKTVTDSMTSFASLLSAQAQTINGIQQALTYGDITSNLQTKLDSITSFQTKLRQLLSLGLSSDAYKQLVDAGVDQGSAYADALLKGGLGAVNQTNSLVAGINKAAADLGLEASNQMYQAGVDAAQGLVDGLNSLSTELESAATLLGNTIANAVKTSLGIASPSKVLIGMMDYVGDGAAIGLDNQKGKVSAAASRFSDNIAVSPEVAAYAAQQSAAGVSGNGTGNGQGSMFRDLIVQTPTEDPKAVALETVNELVGRL